MKNTQWKDIDPKTIRRGTMIGEARYQVLTALQTHNKDAVACRKAMIELQSEAFWRSSVGNDLAGFRPWRKAVRKAYSELVGLRQHAIRSKQDKEAALFLDKAA